MPKSRADLLVVELGLADTRARAQALILAGRVFEGERRVDKPGQTLPADAQLRVTERERYVSRGGAKLEGALVELALDPRGKVALDVGASTGGFSDCLLQHGAAKVYAVDVGHGQLAERLRVDPRVVVRDRTNARALSADDFAETIELCVVDASFIGVGKLLPALARVLGPGALLCAMIKPQFEVGREVARRARGVITDPDERGRAIAAAREAVIAHGFEILGACDSRLPGPKGNVEHFLLARRG